ncbi:SAM-dependent methyltransferase [Candidatus Marinamargulisbacteria bacterium SCGC AG-343-D04]|nr:SAM-dependent methyltransferase [Candidatus Marinamargulisbacteria bacterium SCGC AG-343-D04]
MKNQLNKAFTKRSHLIKPPHNSAFRLLNGFLEGIPGVIAEIYGKSLVCHYYGQFDPSTEDPFLTEIITSIRDSFPWLTAGIVKERKSTSSAHRNGRLVFGTELDTRIQENGVHYTLNLRMNRDTSFYLDTRNLREWVHDHLNGKTVLNTFAYTGSIGVAALAGGASSVTHLDLSHTFLKMAKKSTSLNELRIDPAHFQIGDFWSRINQYKKSGRLFDCVILDPPVFSKTRKGIIDLAKNYPRLINKVRPIIANNGYLITINNALFQTGQAHHDELSELCKDGYLSIESLIPIPEDCVGAVNAPAEGLPANPAPYNHSTKITVLNVKRKH